jgi:hypothetical protein
VCRRLARALIAIASATSLLLCVGVGVLWAGGGYRLFVARYNRVRLPAAAWAYVFEAHSFDGTFRFELDRRSFAPAYLRGLTPAELQMFHVYYPPGLKVLLAGPHDTLEMSTPNSGPTAGHFVIAGRPDFRSDTFVLAVRPWWCMALLLLMPAAWLRRAHKARRAKRLGLCPACGYDLRESPERCPECGAPAQARRIERGAVTEMGGETGAK